MVWWCSTKQSCDGVMHIVNMSTEEDRQHYPLKHVWVRLQGFGLSWNVLCLTW